LRSTKAEALTPATQKDKPHKIDGMRRSTKAEALTPATREGTGIYIVDISRSTKAEALTPATPAYKQSIICEADCAQQRLRR